MIVQWLLDADSSLLGADRLRALLRILPDSHEVQLLTPYIDTHDTNKLATAERFYLQLIALPKYDTNIPYYLSLVHSVSQLLTLTDSKYSIRPSLILDYER